MTIDPSDPNGLEILDYDLEGAAYKKGAVVDGHALILKVRRRGDGNAPIVPLRRLVADMTPDERADLFAAFTTIETLGLAHGQVAYSEQTASPAALDAKVVAAEQARVALEATKAEHAKASEQHAAMVEQLASLSEQIAAGQAKAAELATLNTAIASAQLAEVQP